MTKQRSTGSAEALDTAHLRRDLMWSEWQKQWKDYPSQDNEGYQPDRGSYKAGFLDGFKTADANPPHENGTNTKDVSPEKDTNPPAPSSDDERDAEEYVNNKFDNSLPALKNAMAEIFIAGRKGMIPASEVERLKAENQKLRDLDEQFFARIEKSGKFVSEAVREAVKDATLAERQRINGVFAKLAYESKRDCPSWLVLAAREMFSPAEGGEK